MESPKLTLSDLSTEDLNEFRELNGLSWADIHEMTDIFGGDPNQNQPIVGIQEFIESPQYMDSAGVIYPVVMKALIEANNGNYTESVLTGGIGSGKTTMAVWTQIYQLYVLSCYDSPHALFDLDPHDEIEIIFQSINETLAKELGYSRFKSRVEGSPYFKSMFMFDHRIKSQLRFPNRIIVKPVAGTAAGTIGQNVIGGVLDEVNFMAQTDTSIRNADGSTYDQAVELYNSIASRRKSRFLFQGKLPGMLCIVSSARYRGQFTDVKIEESLTNDLIYVYNKTMYDIKRHAYSKDEFEMFVGDDTRRPHIVTPQKPVSDSDRHLVISIPVDFQQEFEKDPLQALRDTAGVSTTAMHPFIATPELVKACFGVVPSVFSQPTVDFNHHKLRIHMKRVENPKEPRWCHLDLAITQDSAGFAVGHVTKFIKVPRIKDNYDWLPIITLDGILEIDQDPETGEISFEKIRDLLYLLRGRGMNIKWVSADSFQSTDMKQILMKRGFQVGTQSLDKRTLEYDITKTAFYDGRIRAPEHEKCYGEIIKLERDQKKGKIDHRPGGSKDCADAVAGVVAGLSRRREIWARHHIPIREMPASLSSRSAENMKGDENADKVL